MTDERSTTGWNDARLAAAFRARSADSPTPGDLALVAIDRARQSGSQSRSRRGFGYVAVLAAAASVVVAVGALTLGRPIIEPSEDLSEAHGLSILSVAQAVAVRDGAPSDREIAVRGYFSPAPEGLHCPARVLHENPVRLDCPASFQWLLDTPDPLGVITSTLPAGRTGFQPVFPGLDMSALTGPAKQAEEGGSLVEVVVIGHFHDRRGDTDKTALCGGASPADCNSFVADGIYSIAGQRIPSSVVVDLEPWAPEPRREPSWSPSDVASHVTSAVPALEILSTVALPGHRIRELEPSLGTGALGIIDRPIAWLVTGLDPGAGGREPVRRTFLLLDGSAEAYETVPWDVEPRVGFAPVALGSPPGIAASVSPAPSPSSAAFPTKVIGLPVVSVSDVLAEMSGNFDDTELAVRGYFLSESTFDSCPVAPPQTAPSGQACAQPQRWLMEEQGLLADPVSGRPMPTGAAIKPFVHPSVSFDVPLATEHPVPIVVVGHVADHRGDAFNRDFVVDALVWRSGEAVESQLVSSGPSPVEIEAAVTARIDRDLDPAAATWVGIVAGRDLVELDPEAVQSAPELGDAAAVWTFRRLVDEVVDGRARPVVRMAYTADGSNRVWYSPGCCGVDLATTIDVRLANSGAGSDVVQVADYIGTVVAARFTDVGAYADWKPLGGGWDLQVAQTASRELAVRWTADRCDTAWRMDVRDGFGIFLTQPSVVGYGCELPPGGWWAVVLTFDRSVDIERVHTEVGTSGG
jgi:hypothetical protein